jgi:hypothetical protein
MAVPWRSCRRRDQANRRSVLVNIVFGAGLCVILHRSLLNVGTKDLARQAIAAGIPTYLTDSEHAAPRRVRAGKWRLA